jgi:hypothetical protein
MAYSATRLHHVVAHDTIFVSCRKSEFAVFSKVDWSA